MELLEELLMSFTVSQFTLTFIEYQYRNIFNDLFFLMET